MYQTSIAHHLLLCLSLWIVLSVAASASVYRCPNDVKDLYIDGKCQIASTGCCVVYLFEERDDDGTTRWGHDLQPWSSGCEACTFLQDIVKEPSAGSELLIIGDSYSCNGALETALSVIDAKAISDDEIVADDEELPRNREESDEDEEEMSDDESEWILDEGRDNDPEMAARSNQPVRRHHPGDGTLTDESVVSDDPGEPEEPHPQHSTIAYRNCTAEELRHPAEVCTLEFAEVCACLYWNDDTSSLRAHCELQSNPCFGCAALARLKNVLEIHATTGNFTSTLYSSDLCSALRSTPRPGAIVP